MDAPEAYAELICRARRACVLSSCSALLGWDEQTVMPTGGAEHRSGQMGLLAGIYHERATDPRVGELLAIIEGSDLIAEPGSAAAVNMREIRRSYDRRVRLPRTLVEELARTTSLAQPEWVAARSARDFARFRPWLEKIIQLKSQESACLDGQLASDRQEHGHSQPTRSAARVASSAAMSIYDPLVDEYEPGATTGQLAVVFQALRRELVPLAAKIAEASLKRERASAAPGGSSNGVSSCAAGDFDAILPTGSPAGLR